ncbi:MAG: cache domain-containing protein [Lachnospiraceae bacterium]|nr:cache domain-containing protein [Lachnospiraceae bacterium]
MKLKAKFIALSIVPVVVLAIITCIVSYLMVEAKMAEEVYDALKASAIACRDRISMQAPGDYSLEGDKMFKGTYNITVDEVPFDNVKQISGIDTTIFFGDTRYATSVVGTDGKRAVGTQAAANIIEKVLNKGETLTSDSANVAGTPYFAYYLPLTQPSDGSICGMVFAGKSRAKVKEEVMSVVSVIIIAAVAVCIICGIISFIIASGTVDAIKKSIDVVGEISHGNLTAKVDEKASRRSDEVGDLCKYVGELRDRLAEIIGKLKAESSNLYSSSNRLYSTSQNANDAVGQVERAVHEIADGATSQADETQKATENVILMGNMVEETSAQVEELQKNAIEMQKSSEQASAILAELASVNQETVDAIEVISQQTNTTNESALKIRDATNLITEIADETNLLSLNASIEAARAGEQGRGFAVVAAQISKLAEQSNESARKIEEIITSLIADSSKSVETMNHVRDIMTRQNENVQKTDEAFQIVKDGIDRSMDGVKYIADKTAQLDEARVNVVDVVQNLTAIAEENAAGTEETSASATEFGNMIGDIESETEGLKNAANTIEESVGVFTL